MQIDYLIVGQGIVGSTLALELMGRGQRVLVLDRGDAGSSSRVAAGLVTPLTGKGMNPAWRQEAFLPLAKGFYRKLEKESGQAMYHSTPVVRVFQSGKEREKWLAKGGECQQWAELIESGDACIPSTMDLGHGGLKMPEGAWLDTRLFLEVVKNKLLASGSWREEEFNEEELSFTDEGIAWRDVKAKKVILCQGAYGLRSLGSLGEGKYFGSVAHRSAKGEILTVRVNNLTNDYRYHGVGWLAPRADQIWKLGATYEWDELNSNPTDRGKQKLLERLAEWWRGDVEQLEILSHEAGVRPIIRNSRPVMGLHAEHPAVGFFNGLGSKGVLMAPAAAASFAAFLAGEAEFDVSYEIPD